LAQGIYYFFFKDIMMQNFKVNAKGGWIVPAGTFIEPETAIPAFSKFGRGSKFGHRSKFGNDCTLGEYCLIGKGCTIGKGCRIEGLIVKHFLTLANIDGSGRQVLIVSNGKTTLIRAGCFIGTVDKFVERAKSEGKMKYALIIPAVVAAMLQEK
jgi:NDP-sugar pyrophosphorylase family protein